MAKGKRFFDLWLVESNTVYQEVPYEVVTDWLQQGRLLVTDKGKPSGTGDWRELAAIPELAAYAPVKEEHRADDVAEALEPVELELSWKRPADEEDQDVDMIPLIDVSLVLLIFFMMTSTVSGLAANLQLPEVHSAPGGLSSDQLWVSIERNSDNPGAAATYSVGVGNAPAREADRNLDFATVFQHLDDKLSTMGNVEMVTIRGDKNLDLGTVKEVRRELDIRRQRGRIKKVGDEVLERPNS
jgi:biopolymer transport protein ExbD